MKKLIIFVALMVSSIGLRQWEEIIAIVAVVLGVYFMTSIIVFIVIKLDVTILKQYDTEFILLHYKNKVKFYEGPVWGKPRITRIKLKNKWIKKIKGGEDKFIKTELRVEMNSSLTFLIPIKFDCKFLTEFKATDLQKKLKIYPPRNSKERLFSGLHIFVPVIYNYYLESLKMDIIRFGNGKISQYELEDIVVKHVYLPDAFFSNIKITSVSVGAPKLLKKF